MKHTTYNKKNIAEKLSDCSMFHVPCSMNRGFIFLEILIAIALVSIVFISLLSIGFLSLNTSSSIKNTIQADALAKEALEAVRSFRDGTDWSSNGIATLALGSENPYHPSLDAGNPPAWTMVLGSETIGIFTRSIVFGLGCRDSQGNFIPSDDSPLSRVPSCGSYSQDADAAMVTVTVSWGEDKSNQVVTYLTNWKPPPTPPI